VSRRRIAYALARPPLRSRSGSRPAGATPAQPVRRTSIGLQASWCARQPARRPSGAPESLGTEGPSADLPHLPAAPHLRGPQLKAGETRRSCEMDTAWTDRASRRRPIRERPASHARTRGRAPFPDRSRHPQQVPYAPVVSTTRYGLRMLFPPADPSRP